MVCLRQPITTKQQSVGCQSANHSICRPWHLSVATLVTDSGDSVVPTTANKKHVMES